MVEGFLGGKKAKQVFFGWIDLSRDFGGYSEQSDHSVGTSHVSRPRSSVVLMFLVQGFFWVCPHSIIWQLLEMRTTPHSLPSLGCT